MCAREFVFEYVSTHACVCGHVYACVHMCACTSACVRGEGKEWKVEKEEKEMKEEGQGQLAVFHTQVIAFHCLNYMNGVPDLSRREWKDGLS